MNIHYKVWKITLLRKDLGENQESEMEDKKVTIEKIRKYWEVTSKALDLAKKNINKGKEKEAKEIIDMVAAYLRDSEHFEQEGHYVNAFAAVNYAHGWLDSGARLKIFNVKDNKLFTI